VQRIVVDRLSSGPTGILAKLASWPRFAWAAWRALRRELQPSDVVVVCSDPPLFYPLAISAAGRAGARVIHWSQDVYPDVVERHLPSRWLSMLLAPIRAWRNAALRKVDRVAVISRGMGELMQSAGARTALIPNWARDDGIEARVLGDSALRRQHYSDQDFVLAYSGNLGRVHEFATLLAAARLLRSEAQIHFLVVGSGPRLPALKAAVEAEDLSAFRFLPLQPAAQLTDTLAAGDAHFVSLQPGFEGLVLPSKIYSVAAVGRAVLFCGDPEGESARLVAENDFGLAVSQGQGTELAQAIQFMASNRERCAAMGADARQLIDGELSRAVALAKWRQLIAEVAALQSQLPDNN
jgi:glycosyltransferase involved in cell wall biosynthesis